MAWQANLNLAYTRSGERVVARHEHSGPLRILQSLYPEGDSICHNVLVHPPGGLVGGDTLDIAVQAASGTHGLITTPGATRFYRSDGPLALQTTRITLQPEARLEWLPLEALCYSDCHAENRLVMDVLPGAELLGWDVTAFGLPQAHLPFVQGSFAQHIEVPGVWLERGRIDASDARLMDGSAGMNGARCMASLFFVTGAVLDRKRRQLALDIARDLIAGHPLAATAGATSPNSQVIVLRALAPLVEPAMGLLRAVRNAWRQELWQLPECNPRIWAM
ncbi:urease accessory protein [Rhodoferax lacus]|uniref:Urease accessory protein UreD n=1 Tax=Rhodoferax lacus TaxID=2184758 RepID=A0A3E1RE70_9BURK|nr:urease accessory protein UreD [Rhodoferax lacus]RFO97668.1 urease accessory protein [Rhodoferax lacus]